MTKKGRLKLPENLKKKPVNLRMDRKLIDLINLAKKKTKRSFNNIVEEGAKEKAEQLLINN